MKLLELLFQIFQLPTPPPAALYADTALTRSLPLSADGDIVDQYTVALLVGFFNWGLLAALEHVGLNERKVKPLK